MFHDQDVHGITSSSGPLTAIETYSLRSTTLRERVRTNCRSVSVDM